jgi:phenylacetate-CoA ligase
MAAILQAAARIDAGRRTRRFLHLQHETMPRRQLAQLQLARLRATVRNAYDHVPLHRARLDAAGIAPDDIRRLDDLRHLPFTLKTDLRDQYPFGLLARPRTELARLHACSGTAGKPTVVGYTKQDVDHWADLMARSLFAVGARRGDVFHNAHGYGLFTGGLGMHYGAERLGAAVVPVSGGSTERQVALIMDFKPRVMCATPSYALVIAESAERQGVDLRASGLEVGLFGGEPWSAAMRAEIEARLGLKAFDIYGLSEIMGPGVACECECQNGLHGWEDHFLFEVIDPDTGRVLPEGALGELVITTLTREALPMLRYRTRDITRITTAPCDCGRTHLRILRIAGRNDDTLIVRGINVHPSQIEAVLLGRPRIAPQCQLIVDRRGALDHLRVEIEALPGVPAADYAGIANDFAHHVESMVGVGADVQVRPPGEIPRFDGSAVRVRDLRPKTA